MTFSVTVQVTMGKVHPVKVGHLTNWRQKHQKVVVCKTGNVEWNGLVEWTRGMDLWNGLVEWMTCKSQVHSRNSVG